MFAIKWFLGLNKAKKTIMSILVAPLAILLVILIVEKLSKFLWFVGDISSNAISHIFSKDNRSAYIITSVSMLLFGGYLEYSQGFITYVIDFGEYCIDQSKHIWDYINILS